MSTADDQQQLDAWAQQPCDCRAYDPDHNDHTRGQHTMCFGARECGGCDNCIDMAMSATGGAA